MKRALMFAVTLAIIAWPAATLLAVALKPLINALHGAGT